MQSQVPIRTKRNTMTASEAIITMYQIIEKAYGPIEAKNGVSDIVFNIIDDIYHSGLPMTEENLTKHLEKYANDYIEASRTDVA